MLSSRLTIYVLISMRCQTTSFGHHRGSTKNVAKSTGAGVRLLVGSKSIDFGGITVEREFFLDLYVGIFSIGMHR